MSGSRHLSAAVASAGTDALAACPCDQIRAAGLSWRLGNCDLMNSVVLFVVLCSAVFAAPDLVF
jgi:hypothetical protein